MKILTVDFETYYDQQFSLSKMQTDAYVLDPRFETIGVTVAKDDEPPTWFSGTEEETLDWLWQFDWANSAVCAHHTLFDGFIMSRRYGIRPKLWMDTLSMARRLMPHLASHSLAKLATEFGLAPKGNEVVTALGKHRADFSPYDLAAYGNYCKHDTHLCHQLMNKFLPRTSPLDLKLIDMTVRMFTEPQFEGDIDLLEQQHATEIARKSELLAKADVDKETVMSNAKMAAALEALGVPAPTKISPRTGAPAYAFAKTDKAFTDLLTHDMDEVQALVGARLGVKTSIAETRVMKMLETAQRGPLPVYLNFWGAKTTGRYSGGNSINWQNLPVRGISAGIRKGIRAPAGRKIIVGDSSNIELRVVMAGASQDDVLQKIYDGIDLYCDFATKLFGHTITPADKKERTLGKIAMLSLQYGAGAERFREMVRIQSGDLLTLDQAQRIVDLYRAVHARVVEMWDYCNVSILPDIAAGCDLLAVDKPGWAVTSNDGFGIGGEPGVKYHKLRREQVTRGSRTDVAWVYDMGREKVVIHGSKVVENWGQHVAGRIVLWQTARINERYPVALSVHDEAVCVVDEREVEDARAYMQECLTMAPAFCRGQIPLGCEIGVGDTYAGAK